MEQGDCHFKAPLAIENPTTSAVEEQVGILNRSVAIPYAMVVQVRSLDDIRGWFKSFHDLQHFSQFVISSSRSAATTQIV